MTSESMTSPDREGSTFSSGTAPAASNSPGYTISIVVSGGAADNHAETATVGFDSGSVFLQLTSVNFEVPRINRNSRPLLGRRCHRRLPMPNSRALDLICLSAPTA